MHVYENITKVTQLYICLFIDWQFVNYFAKCSAQSVNGTNMPNADRSNIFYTITHPFV